MDTAGWGFWFWKINAILSRSSTWERGELKTRMPPPPRILGCPECYILHRQWRVSAYVKSLLYKPRATRKGKRHRSCHHYVSSRSRDTIPQLSPRTETKP